MKKERIPNGIYTKEFREEALKLITEGGLSVRRRRTGMYVLLPNNLCISYKGDEGGPFEVGFQEQASNHSKLLW